MDILRRHEIFEIEALERLKNGNFLTPLVFGGGTMLRLCYDMNRYSTDLDFWVIKKIDYKDYFRRLKKYLGEQYELTDAQMKFYTLLFEIRSKDYPKRLKIEIRRGMKTCDFQERIAFSKHSTKQVILRVCTLEQMMKNKFEAVLARRDIRDCFDIEFLLRQGAPLPARPKLIKLKNLIVEFKDRDYRVALGSVLEPKMRTYYVRNKFEYLLGKINAATEEAARK